MPKKLDAPEDRTVELLEKLLVFELYRLGATQDRIARVVGKGKVWVNSLLKGMPKQEG